MAEPARTKIEWLRGVCFAGTSASGHTVLMDGAADSGGGNRGPRPMEMLLLGLGGCTAFDVVTILQKGRHAVSGCNVELSAERALSPPRVFTRIHLHYTLSGSGLQREPVERAIRLSAEKYCSATAMLAKTAEITHDFEILAGSGDEPRSG